MASHSFNKQRIIIKFYTKLGKSFFDIREDLQKVYGEAALSKGAISKWMKGFKDGREATEDGTRAGRPVSVTDEEIVAAIQEYILRDRRVSVEHVADKFPISYGTAQGIMTVRLGMRRFSTMVPRLLMSEQMAVRVKMCQQYDRRYREESDYFLNRVITCDEMWIHFFELESKRQSSVWKHPSSPSPTKALISKSAGKVMAIIFCDTYGVVLNHFVPPKTTVTGNYYATLLRTELMAAIRRKCPHLLRSRFILHQDNAPSHSSHVVMDMLEKLDVKLLPHPPYSPELAIYDFWLFPTLKNSLRGMKFESREELRCAVDRQLQEISRDGLQHVFESWVKRWDKCKSCMGRSFEKE